MPTVRAPITCDVTVNRKNNRRFWMLEKVGGKSTIAEKSTGAENRDCRKSRFIRYLRDRGCGDRWNRSTSHRKQRNRKLKIASHCHRHTEKTHCSRFEPRYIPISVLPGIWELHVRRDDPDGAECWSSDLGPRHVLPTAAIFSCVTLSRNFPPSGYPDLQGLPRERILRTRSWSDHSYASIRGIVRYDEKTLFTARIHLKLAVALHRVAQ